MVFIDYKQYIDSQTEYDSFWKSSICFFLFCLQMVVVSDDVHEYAVALKDTEEKIARCPSKVKTSG